MVDKPIEECKLLDLGMNIKERNIIKYTISYKYLGVVVTEYGRKETNIGQKIETQKVIIRQVHPYSRNNTKEKCNKIFIVVNICKRSIQVL